MRKRRNKTIDEPVITQGNEKVCNYFRFELVKNEKFLNFVCGLREKYLRKISDELYEFPLSFDDFPNSWNQSVPGYFREISAFCDQNSLNYLDFRFLIDNFARHNIVDFEMASPSMQNLCYLTDHNLDDEVINKYDNLTHPLSIRISPFATEKDIIDFVTKTYSKYIEPMQKRYMTDSMLGKTRNRLENIQERDDFIYEHRNIHPRKMISDLLYEQFGVRLDVGYIGKIISRETKRRQDNKR